MMQIFVDGDACPIVCKEILYRVAERLQLNLAWWRTSCCGCPARASSARVQVPGGMDVADQEIVRLARARRPGGDGRHSAGQPWCWRRAASRSIRAAISTPADNIAQLLTMRAFMEELRSGGVETGGPAPYGNADRQNFANQLDRHLARYAK